jgi:predicted GNAT family N-acyltransferase
MPEFSVRRADWGRDRDALHRIRTRVFVEEQNVPPTLEWDGLDEQCLHMLATSNNAPIGTGRLTPDANIGRMAVLAEWRGHGVGKALLESLMHAAIERGDTTCQLNAQVTAIGFYERFGFVAHGEVFMDAGIPHRTMTRHIANAPSPLPPRGGKGDSSTDKPSKKNPPCIPPSSFHEQGGKGRKESNDE